VGWLCVTELPAWPTRACSHYKHTSDGGHFVAGQGAVSTLHLLHMSELQRKPAAKWPRPFGLRPKSGHAVLLVVRLASPNISPRALPGAFPGIKTAWPPPDVVQDGFDIPRFMRLRLDRFPRRADHFRIDVALGPAPRRGCRRLYVASPLRRDSADGQIGEELVRYNKNGIELDVAAHAQLNTEISLRRLSRRGEQPATFFYR